MIFGLTATPALEGLRTCCALVAGEYAVEDVQHYDNSNPKQNLEREILLLDDFFVEAAASWGVEVFGFVVQGVCS